MATKKSGNAFFDAQKFAKSLSELIATLPSESDKQRIVSQLETLIQFLSNLRVRIQGIPSQDDAAAVRGALDSLTALFSQAKANPVVGAAIGLKTTQSRVRPSLATSEEIERANSAIARFDSLPIDEIRSTLDTIGPRDLQTLAKVLGLRTSQRTAREALVHQIATKITNTRGYRSLRDGTDESQG